MGRARSSSSDRLLHVVSPHGGESHTIGTGDAQQRRPAHGERLDRPHQGGHIGADQLDLLGGQPGLVEKHQYGPFRRLVPAQRRKRGRLVPDRVLCVLISHPPSLPGERTDNEGAKEIRAPGPPAGNAWHDGCQPAAPPSGQAP